MVLHSLPCIVPPTQVESRALQVQTLQPGFDDHSDSDSPLLGDTLFVKGKEMWHGAGSKPDAVRALKQVRKGDRVLCYHSAPERSFYSIAEVSRDPYPDPHDSEGKNLVADLRAFEKLPRQVTLAELRSNKALRKVKFLKNVRLIVSPISDAEYLEILKMAGIVATPGIPLP